MPPPASGVRRRRPLRQLRTLQPRSSLRAPCARSRRCATSVGEGGRGARRTRRRWRPPLRSWRTWRRPAEAGRCRSAATGNPAAGTHHVRRRGEARGGGRPPSSPPANPPRSPPAPSCRHRPRAQGGVCRSGTRCPPLGAGLRAYHVRHLPCPRTAENPRTAIAGR